MAVQASPSRRTTTTRRPAARSQSKAVARTGRTQGTSVARTARTARTAKADARDLTGTVRVQAAQIRDELASQTRAIVDEAKTRVQVEAHVPVRRAAEGITKLAKGTRALSETAPDDAVSLGTYLSQGADKLYEVAEKVYGLADDVESGDLDLEAVLADVQRFARRRPAAFLLGAAVAGFGVGRVVLASRSEDEADSQDFETADYDAEGYETGARAAGGSAASNGGAR